MKAIALDMYGVLMRQSGNDFGPWVQQRIPTLTMKDIQGPWLQADQGEISSVEALAAMGFTGDLEQIERSYLDTIVPMPGAAEFLRSMQGRFRLSLISNDPGRWSDYIRSKHGLNAFFEVISVSGDVKIAKPDPRIYELTLARMGLPASECMYVDDRRENLETAARLGMRAVMMGDNPQGWEGEIVGNFEELAVLLPSDNL